MLLITFLLWIGYSILEGFREGYYWHYKSRGEDGNRYEIHPVFSAQRGLVLAVMFMLVFITTHKLFGLILMTSLLKAGFFTFSLMLIFSFIHNGVYYTTRNVLNKKIYKLKWKDHSKTSTAKWTKFLTFRNRTIMFALGLIGILICVL